MEFASHVSHYFEKEAGPLLSICDLAPEQMEEQRVEPDGASVPKQGN